MTNAEQEQAANPVANIMGILHDAGHKNFDGKNIWENCLCAMIMALDPRCKTYRLLEALPYRKKAFDRVDALNTLAHLGYVGRMVETSAGDIDSRLLPCLFIRSNGEPLVILGESRKSLKVYKGARLGKISKKKIKKSCGTVWIFERFDENRTTTSKFMRAGSGHNWFRALLGRFSGTFAQILTAGLMLNIIALTTPIFIMLVYDRVIAAGSIGTLPMLVVGVCLAIGFEWILRRMRSRGLSWLAARMDNIVGNRIFSHLIGLSPDLIEKASVAAQIARIKTFESVRDFFSGSVFLSMLEMPFVVLAALAIYTLAGPLVFVPVGMGLAYGLLFWFSYNRIKVAIRLAAKASSARQQFTIETFEKIRGIRCYGLSQHWHSKFRDLSGREMVAHFHLGWLGMISETAAHSLTLFSAVATVGFGVHLIWAGSMTSGALVATMILVWRVLMPFYSLCTMIPRLEQLRNSIIQVNTLMDLDTEATQAHAMARLPKVRGRVTFSHVSLRYSEDSDTVFSNLDFDARAGDMVAITGQNGSGKTSLLKMIKSLYKAEQGAVQIDGFDIRQLDAPDLRRQIAYVPQQPDFFKGTILENMRIGNPLATESDIENALQLADAWEDVVSLPEGLRTIIGKYGSGDLPYNLLTRLSLARAYLHIAPIMLIDELSNALLSGRTGKNLKDYLARTKGKRTIFMVTYREDFMRFADTIITLRRGEAPEAGPTETILDALNQEAA